MNVNGQLYHTLHKMWGGQCPCGLWPHVALLTLLIPHPAALAAQ